MPTADQLTAPLTHHGEGPCWSPSWGGLAFVDMLVGDVCFLQPDDSVRRWHLGRVVAVLRPRLSGGLVAATERNFVLADEPFGELQVLDEVFADRSLRFNEGACDPAGNFLVGSMSWAEAENGRAAVYRMTPDRRTEQVLDGVSTSNGLCWTAAGDRAYYVDSPTRRIDVFDSGPAGELRHRRPFATTDAGDAVPDGLTVDADGGVWVAMNGAGAVHHYDPSGVLQERIELPTPQVTACTFGGPGLTRLYITTSRQNMDVPGNDPAGAVFTVETGVPGLPTRPFAG